MTASASDDGKLTMPTRAYNGPGHACRECAACHAEARELCVDNNGHDPAVKTYVGLYCSGKVCDCDWSAPCSSSNRPHGGYGGASDDGEGNSSNSARPGHLHLEVAALTATLSDHPSQWLADLAGDRMWASFGLEAPGKPEGAAPHYVVGGGRAQFTALTAVGRYSGGQLIPLGPLASAPSWSLQLCSSKWLAAARKARLTSGWRHSTPLIAWDGSLDAVLTFGSVNATWVTPTVPEAGVARCARGGGERGAGQASLRAPGACGYALVVVVVSCPLASKLSKQRVHACMHARTKCACTRMRAVEGTLLFVLRAGPQRRGPWLACTAGEAAA